MKLRDADGNWVQDPLLDDLSMVIETEKGKGLAWSILAIAPYVIYIDCLHTLR